MASQAPVRGKGKNTPEYQRVLGNMGKITEALATTPGAKEALSEKCKEKGRLSLSVNPTEKELVEFWLVRIDQNTDQFDVFVSMLGKIAGLDLIVECLKLTGIYIQHWKYSYYVM